jgi:hypothetical protein
MAIQRVPNVPFAQIANSALRDRRLSFKARGILALVLSNIGEWEATTGWIAQQSSKDGDSSVQTGLNELTALGYRRVLHEQDAAGRVRTVTEWFHEPFFRSPGNPGTGGPDDRKRGVTIEDYPKEHYLQEHDRETKPPLGAGSMLHLAMPESSPQKPSISHPEVFFPAFWKVYPRKVGKGAAEKAFAKAVKDGAVPDELVQAAEKFSADSNLPEAQFIPHPATWLNQRRWEDEPLPERGQQTGGERRMGAYKSLYQVFAEEERKGIQY